MSETREAIDLIRSVAGCLTIVACVPVAVALSVAVMIYGWGLEPRSWWWILLGALAQVVLAQLLIHATKTLWGDR